MPPRSILGSFLVRAFEAEEQEDGVGDEGGCDAAQRVHEQVELGLLEAVLLEPLEHLFLGHQVAAIDGREPAPEVDHRRELGHAVLAGVARVFDLDERDVQVVRLGVDVLQLFEHLLALGTVALVWQKETKR